MWLRLMMMTTTTPENLRRRRSRKQALKHLSWMVDRIECNHCRAIAFIYSSLVVICLNLQVGFREGGSRNEYFTTAEWRFFVFSWHSQPDEAGAALSERKVTEIITIHYIRFLKEVFIRFLRRFPALTVKSVLYGVRFTAKMPPINIVRLQPRWKPRFAAFLFVRAFMSVSLPNDVHSVPLRLILCLFLIAQPKLQLSWRSSVCIWVSDGRLYWKRGLVNTQQGVLHNWSCNGRKQSKGSKKIKFSDVVSCADPFLSNVDISVWVFYKMSWWMTNSYDKNRKKASFPKSP